VVEATQAIMEDYRLAPNKEQHMTCDRSCRKPPIGDIYKLNFDRALFKSKDVVDV
jgi:hypothetical protein